MSVPRWYENLRSDPADAVASEQARLIGDVSHAAGNLIHRMYYLTGVIEEEPSEGGALGALSQIRESLGSLHQLLNRTFALVQPVHVRPVPVAATDLVKSLTLRFGENPSGSSAELLAHLTGYELGVDLVHLDRALTMLAEALGRGDRASAAAPAASSWSVSVMRAAGQQGPRSQQLSIDLVIDPAVGERELLSDGVQRAVGLALVGRVFGLFGWNMQVDESARPRRVRILAPLEPVAVAVASPIAL